MKRKHQQFELDHWRTEEILHTYAELERARGSAAKIYPDTARHLLECGVCRDTLEDILTTTEIAIPRRRVAANDLGFLRRLRQMKGQRPVSAFNAQVMIPLKTNLEIGNASLVRRSALPHQTSDPSRPIFLDMVRLGAHEYVLLVTLYQSTQLEHFRLTGELSADESEFDAIKICLTAGKNAYTAHLVRNHFLFDDVVISADLEHLRLSFEQS